LLRGRVLPEEEIRGRVTRIKGEGLKAEYDEAAGGNCRSAEYG
tara:strand:+ start:921 stop:1049 length:129 start_codon:yes stop_codon:yes gene_type:complete